MIVLVTTHRDDDTRHDSGDYTNEACLSYKSDPSVCIVKVHQIQVNQIAHLSTNEYVESSQITDQRAEGSIRSAESALRRAGLT